MNMLPDFMIRNFSRRWRAMKCNQEETVDETMFRSSIFAKVGSHIPVFIKLKSYWSSSFEGIASCINSSSNPSMRRNLIAWELINLTPQVFIHAFLLVFVGIIIASTQVNAQDTVMGYDQIKCEGTAANRRGTINFTDAGATCTDDSANNETEVSGLGGSGSGDNVTVNSSAVDTTANLLDGDIDWTLVDGGAGGPDSITGTVSCSGCIDVTDLGADSVGSSEVIESADLTIHDLALSGVGPDISWVVSGGDTWHAGAESGGAGGVWFLSNTTDGKHFIEINGSGGMSFPQLTSCDTIDTSADGTLSCGTDSGGGGNSFETIAVPAGSSVVADSSTDTLTITETTFLTFTGTAATDTIDITQVTTDIGTDGLIAANAVALGTDTTNNYVATIADAGNANITVANSGTETAAITLDVVDVTCTACLSATELGTDSVSADELNATGVEAELEAALDIGGEVTSTGMASTVIADTITVTGWVLGTSSATTFTSPTVNIDLLDGVGAVDMDYGSADITDHTFTSDGGTVILDGIGTFSGLVTANANLTIGNGATTAGVLTLLEDTDAGSNFASFQVPALAANTVYTLPIDDGAASEVLSTDGAGALDWVAAGAGDITDVYNCASGDCNNIVLADGDLLNMSSVSVSATTEGLILPQHATDCSTAGTAEGQVCWEADADALYVGNATTVTKIGGDDLDFERAWPASAMEPLEAADSIPPLTKTTGTNIDEFTISYDAATDEGRKVTFVVPNDVAAGTVTFSIYWTSLTATTGTVQWDIRSTATGADSEAWDAALTTDTTSCTVDGTVREFDVCVITETVANLGWAAGDRISLELVRDANHASGDTMTGDAELSMFHVRIPVS